VTKAKLQFCTILLTDRDIKQEKQLQLQLENVDGTNICFPSLRLKTHVILF